MPKISLKKAKTPEKSKPVEKKEPKVETTVEFVSAKDVKLIRDLVRNEGKIKTAIVSVKDIPDFGLDKDFMVVLIKFGDVYYADTVIVSKKVKAGDTVIFFMAPGESFPHADLA